jgi:hypothetical protein
MAKTRRVLKALSVERASRKRKCHHSGGKHGIAGGDRCLVVNEPDGGKKNYCVECGNAILEVADDALATLRQSLNA